MMQVYSGLLPAINQIQALQFSVDHSPFPSQASQLSPRVFGLLSANALGYPVNAIT